MLYLWLNQAAYAIVALPIGIVLSIAPLYLNRQLGVSVPVVGLFMTGGELLGVLAMWAAERAKSGFILRRPHDIPLIICSVASFVALILVWPKDLWYLAATCMVVVQALNSASKPVVGEAIHRMATLMRKQPSLVFAQANMWRRVGNAIVGIISPLVYAASPRAAFCIPWPILIAFVVVILVQSVRISQASDTCSDALRSMLGRAPELASTSRRSSVSNLVLMQEAVTAMQTTARAHQNAWCQSATPTALAKAQRESCDPSISRASTHESTLTDLPGRPLDSSQVVTSWSLRPPRANAAFLREVFCAVVAESSLLPPDQRLIMYDACDNQEVVANLGPCLRKRLDARRGTKPSKSNEQLLVCTPFDPASFSFMKIKNQREKLLKLQFSTGGNYEVLTNKFPLFPAHMLMVAKEPVPQQMQPGHLLAITELLQGCSGFSAYFNSWCASASVNHFHIHLIDEQPPITHYPLVPGPHVCGQKRCLQPKGFPGFCYVFEVAQLELVGEVIRTMQFENQPHNALFTGRFIYLFPKPLQRPDRSFELYPETVGGPELIGSFTVYQHADYNTLTKKSAEELTRMNTALLPSRLLHRGGDHATPALSGSRAGKTPTSRTADPSITTLETYSVDATVAIIEADSDDLNDDDDYRTEGEGGGPTGKKPEVVSARGKPPPPLLRFLVIHLFSFCDAALSRLPFAFLTIAVANSSPILLASAVLCAYQLARAISQWVQTKKCDESFNYAACTMAVILYFSLIVYLDTSIEPTLWYIPIIITGAAETLAVQQYFLVCIYTHAKGGTVEPDDLQVRRAVKASHTGTGLGSALAFIASSQTYGLYGLRGVAYLGLAIALLKTATSVAIGVALPRSCRCISPSKM